MAREKERKELEAEIEALRKENREKDLALIDITKEHAQLQADFEGLELRMEEHICGGGSNQIERGY